MTEVKLLLDPATVLFYSKIAQITGKTLEQILTDALFKLAGELSMRAIRPSSADL